MDRVTNRRFRSILIPGCGAITCKSARNRLIVIQKGLQLLHRATICTALDDKIMEIIPNEELCEGDIVGYALIIPDEYEANGRDFDPKSRTKEGWTWPVLPCLVTRINETRDYVEIHQIRRKIPGGPSGRTIYATHARITVSKSHLIPSSIEF